MASAAQINPRLEGIRVAGKGWSRDIAAAVTSAQLELPIDEASQLTLTVLDPGLKLAAAGWFRRGLFVDYEDQHLIIATSELGPGPAGSGQVTVGCWPRGVYNARQRRGKLAMRNVSPSDFVRREGEAAGMRVIAQPNARRKVIFRDTPTAGQFDTYKNSSWTTFRRLADELGYYCFEHANTLFFASPSWLRGKLGTVSVGWAGYPESSKTIELPTARVSLDALHEATISFKVASNRAAMFRPGRVAAVGGIGPYSGTYTITKVSLELAIDQPVDVEASRGTDPTFYG